MKPSTSKMKVKDIGSYFTSSTPPTTTTTIQVPLRKTKKKPTQNPDSPPPNVDFEASSDEEDPLPKSVREKQKEKNKKRKAKVLKSDSDEEDFVQKKEPPKKVKVQEKKVEQKNVDPGDFFSKDKVKREKVVKESPKGEERPMSQQPSTLVKDKTSEKHSDKKEDKATPEKHSPRKKPLSDEEDEEDFNPKQKPPPKHKSEPQKPPKTPPPPKKAPKATPTPEEKAEADKKRAANFAKFKARSSAQPRHLGEKVLPTGTKDCLLNKTFVLTGALNYMEKESCKDLVERHGGRMTTGVSKKTTHLIVGDDPGGVKTKKAEELGIPMISEDQLLEMIRSSNPDGNNNDDVEMMDLDDEEEEEPIAKVESKIDPPHKQIEIKRIILPPSLMWVDKYRPKLMKQIVGQVKENSNARKLVRWLNNWFNHHGSANDKPKPAAPYFKDPEGKTFKCALLSGPPGVGKTTSAHLACKEVGYDYFEMNASDTRNKRGLHDHISDALSSKTMFGMNLTNRHVLIMDEVDGMSGNEDRGGVQELISLIKSSRVPIICICNDRNHPKIRSLANYCFDLRFNRPTMQELKGFIASIAFKEKLKVDPQKLNQLCISTDMDIRQILHQLELYKESDADNVLYPKKDLRFGPWDVCRKIFYKPEHENLGIHEKNGLFFQDYNIGSLFVQENYLKWIPARARQNKHARLELLARTAASIAEGDLTDTLIRRTNNWGLLPVQGIFSSYVPGELMESNLTGGIDFPQWLGKNSNKNKRHRLLQSIHTHVHLQVSASLEALNMDYLPYLRRKICGELTTFDVETAAGVMEAYSLLRDDIESINDLSLWPGMKNPMEKIDGKTKAAFTRMVNKEMLPYANDKSVGGKRGRKNTDLDMDGYGEEEDEVEESEEEEKLDAMIKMKTKKKKGEVKEEVGGGSKAKKSRKK